MPIEETAANIVMVEQRQRYFADALNDPRCPTRSRAFGGSDGQLLSVMTPMMGRTKHRSDCRGSRAERRFSEKELHLLQTFADQAVIAIQNVRLFNETKEALAAADSHGRRAEGDRIVALEPPAGVRRHRRALERAHARPFNYGVSPYRQHDRTGRVHASQRWQPTRYFARHFPDRARRFQASIWLSAARCRRPSTPIGAEPQSSRNIAHARGFRGRLVVPLKSDSGIIGAISITRKEPGAFAEKDK